MPYACGLALFAQAQLTRLNGPVRAVADHHGALVVGGDCSSVYFLGITGYWSGIDGRTRPMALGLSPNPVADQLSIVLPEALGANPTLRLMDMTGRTIEAPVTRGGAALLLGVSGLPPGNYTVEVSGSGAVATGRFTRE